MSGFFQMRNEQSIQGLEDLIKFISNNPSELKMIEIGSYIGESTKIFARHFKSVVSIDPYINNYDLNDAACHAADFEDVYKEFLKNMQSYNNVVSIRKKSEDAVVDLADTKFDFIYIDGMHTYDAVVKDITNYKRLVKKGGYIGGHDYSEYCPGVVKAVNELLGKPTKVFQDSSWLFKI